MDFCTFLTPHELNFELLMKNSKKENEKECVKAVLYIVILEYSLYSKLSCCIRFIQGPSEGNKDHLFGATSSPSVANFCLRKTAHLHEDEFDKVVVVTVNRNMSLKTNLFP